MPIPLDDQICFTLYATSMAINRTYKPMLDGMGITYPQYLILCVLGEEGGVTVGAIANRLFLEPSTVTPPLKRMQQAGLVTRERSVHDERQVEVRLTDQGRTLLKACECLGQTLIARSGTTEDHLSTLNRELKRIRAALAEE